MSVQPTISSPEAQRWQDEISAWNDRTRDWFARADKVIRRYRDMRPQQATEIVIFNSLWSNTQTLKPALYSSTPVPIVERRYGDRDPVARVASQILERNLKYAIEEVKFSDKVPLAVENQLLPGLGQLWVRYDPEFGEGLQIGSDDAAREGTDDAGYGDEDSEQEEADEEESEDTTELKRERVALDYVYWKDFLFSESRVWEEVSWVGRRVFMTRGELIKRFGEEKGRRVKLDYQPSDLERQLRGGSLKNTERVPTKAEVYEFWCLESRSVYWVSKSYPEVLDQREDPLRLEGFWPCAKPLVAVTTTETLLPIPFYAMYQDQARELDDLTARIAALTKALKVAGVYDSSVPELQRLFTESTENRLIPVANWAQFAQKGGLVGAISMVPLKELADTLLQLYAARDRVKADMYEITGLSDIVRGQAANAATATEQRIKGQFASLRLRDLQKQVAEFCLANLRIMAEMIAEHYSPQTLVQISGIEFVDSLANVPQAPALPPDAPPEAQQQAAQVHAMQVQQARADAIAQAIALLRNDKLRGFRVNVETDSTLEPDEQAEKEARVQFIQAASTFMQQAVQAATQVPQLAPLSAQMLLFVVRGFKVGRPLEAAIEDTADELVRMAESAKAAPPQPSPEQIKAQAEQQKTQMDLQAKQTQMQLDAQKAAMEMQARQREMELQAAQDVRDSQIAEQEMQLKQQEIALKQTEIEIRVREIQLKAAEVALRHQQLQQRVVPEAQAPARPVDQEVDNA